MTDNVPVIVTDPRSHRHSSMVSMTPVTLITISETGIEIPGDRYTRVAIASLPLSLPWAFLGVSIFQKIATPKIASLNEFPIETPIATPSLPPAFLGVSIYRYPQLSYFDPCWNRQSLKPAPEEHWEGSYHSWQKAPVTLTEVDSHIHSPPWK